MSVTRIPELFITNENKWKQTAKIYSLFIKNIYLKKIAVPIRMNNAYYLIISVDFKNLIF